jgi:hypothetical protein
MKIVQLFEPHLAGAGQLEANVETAHDLVEIVAIDEHGSRGGGARAEVA